MKDDDLLEWLTYEERIWMASAHEMSVVRDIFRSLVECREILADSEWKGWADSGGFVRSACIECGQQPSDGHSVDCFFLTLPRPK